MFLEHGIAYELHTIYDDLARRGALPSLMRRLDDAQALRERFGPSALAALDGEPLLRRLHGREAEDDSLVSHLERPSDETVGALMGGSAFRYDLFFSGARESWIVGTPTDSRAVTMSEAIERARRQRDELVAAATAVDALPSDADEAAYAVLQSTIARAAPTLGETGWFHKYLSGLFPEKIDPFHAPETQRHHLLRLLLRPPADLRHARFAMAGLFVGVARALGDVPLPHLGALLAARHGRRPRAYWRVATRRPDQSVAAGLRLWESMLRDGYATFGRTKAETSARAGDAIVATGAEGGVIGLGVVRAQSGGYHFAEDRVPVEWRSLETWALPTPERETRDARPRSLGRRDENVREIERHLLTDAAPFQPEPLVARPKGRGRMAGTQTAQAATRVGEERSEYQARESSPVEHAPVPSSLPLPPLTGMTARIESVLDRKGQVILHGPPGTGKTYGAETAARELAARAWFGVSANRLTPAQSAALVGEGEGFGLPLPPGGAVRFCCFHPAYGYEDFLEGYRPAVADHADAGTTGGDALRFELRDGIFKQLCCDAAAHPRGPFFLIVDEINRGDTPRIFGELLSVLEPGKRGKRVLLPLSGESFAVPPNVFLLGTMNTTDRSIAVLDAALRRRFGFIETPPDYSLLADTCVQGLPVAAWLATLNRRIRERLGADGRHLQIGHAYFLRPDGTPLGDLPSLACVLRDDILPLIEEHAYEDPGLLAALLGDDLIDTRRGAVRDELFAPGREDDLRRALLGFLPLDEIVESPDLSESPAP